MQKNLGHVEKLFQESLGITLLHKCFMALISSFFGGGGRGASPVFTSIIEIVPVVIFDLH